MNIDIDQERLTDELDALGAISQAGAAGCHSRGLSRKPTCAAANS